MLTEEEARGLVAAELARVERAMYQHLGVAISRVEPGTVGWVFYRCARRDIGRPAGQRPTLGGNGPFGVDRKNERLLRGASSEQPLDSRRSAAVLLIG